MRNITKKLVAFSMIGLFQTGLGASIIEASPLIQNFPPAHQQYDNRDNGDRSDRHDDRKEREREHDKRLREENERHEKEMKRHRHESEREWHERQQRENERHDRELGNIAALLIGIAIGSASNN